MEKQIKYYENGTTVRLIEGDTQVLPIDVFDFYGSPADLSGAQALFHLMEFSTRSHIWTKEFTPVFDIRGDIPNIKYPYTVMVTLDTDGLMGHYIGQLELVDHSGNSKRPFEIEIIISKWAGE